MADESLTIHLEADEVMKMLNELAAVLAKESVDISHLPSELIGMKADYSSAQAGEIVVRLYPTDRLRGLASALRAR